MGSNYHHDHSKQGTLLNALTHCSIRVQPPPPMSIIIKMFILGAPLDGFELPPRRVMCLDHHDHSKQGTLLIAVTHCSIRVQPPPPMTLIIKMFILGAPLGGIELPPRRVMCLDHHDHSKQGTLLIAVTHCSIRVQPPPPMTLIIKMFILGAPLDGFELPPRRVMCLDHHDHSKQGTLLIALTHCSICVQPPPPMSIIIKMFILGAPLDGFELPPLGVMCLDHHDHSKQGTLLIALTHCSIRVQPPSPMSIIIEMFILGAPLGGFELPPWGVMCLDHHDHSKQGTLLIAVTHCSSQVQPPPPHDFNYKNVSDGGSSGWVRTTPTACHVPGPSRPQQARYATHRCHSLQHPCSTPTPHVCNYKNVYIGGPSRWVPTTPMGCHVPGPSRPQQARYATHRCHSLQHLCSTPTPHVCNYKNVYIGGPSRWVQTTPMGCHVPGPSRPQQARYATHRSHSLQHPSSTPTPMSIIIKMFILGAPLGGFELPPWGVMCLDHHDHSKQGTLLIALTHCSIRVQPPTPMSIIIKMFILGAPLDGFELPPRGVLCLDHHDHSKQGTLLNTLTHCSICVQPPPPMSIIIKMFILGAPLDGFELPPQGVMCLDHHDHSKQGTLLIAVTHCSIRVQPPPPMSIIIKMFILGAPLDGFELPPWGVMCLDHHDHSKQGTLLIAVTHCSIRVQPPPPMSIIIKMFILGAPLGGFELPSRGVMCLDHHDHSKQGTLLIALTHCSICVQPPPPMSITIKMFILGAPLDGFELPPTGCLVPGPSRPQLARYATHCSHSLQHPSSTPTPHVYNYKNVYIGGPSGWVRTTLTGCHVPGPSRPQQARYATHRCHSLQHLCSTPTPHVYNYKNVYIGGPSRWVRTIPTGCHVPGPSRPQQARYTTQRCHSLQYPSSTPTPHVYNYKNVYDGGSSGWVRTSPTTTASKVRYSSLSLTAASEFNPHPPCL